MLVYMRTTRCLSYLDQTTTNTYTFIGCTGVLVFKQNLEGPNLILFRLWYKRM